MSSDIENYVNVTLLCFKSPKISFLQKAERESPGHYMPGLNRRSFEGGEEREMRPRKALDEKRLA